MIKNRTAEDVVEVEVEEGAGVTEVAMVVAMEGMVVVDMADMVTTRDTIRVMGTTQDTIRVMGTIKDIIRVMEIIRDTKVTFCCIFDMTNGVFYFQIILQLIDGSKKRDSSVISAFLILFHFIF